MACHLSRATERIKEIGVIDHGRDLCDSFAHNATNFSHCIRANFSQHRRMVDLPPVTERLKRLREATEPRLTVRATADALGIPSSTYAAYEDPKKFKKPNLPITISKEIAKLFSAHGVAASEVLALAGLNAEGALAPRPEDIADQLDAVLLPEVDVGLSMGGGNDLGDFPVVQQVPFSRTWLRGLTSSPPSQLMVARGDGDSMMPTILDQDIVIIDRAQATIRQQDRIWALSYGGFGMIKRVRGLPDGTYQINSDNNAVTPIIAADGEMFTIGRIVGIVRRI